MTTYLRLLYPQLLPDLLHSNATGSACQKLTVINANPGIASGPGNLSLFGATSQFRHAKQDCGP